MSVPGVRRRALDGVRKLASYGRSCARRCGTAAAKAPHRVSHSVGCCRVKHPDYSAYGPTRLFRTSSMCAEPLICSVVELVALRSRGSKGCSADSSGIRPAAVLDILSAARNWRVSADGGPSAASRHSGDHEDQRGRSGYQNDGTDLPSAREPAHPLHPVRGCRMLRLSVGTTRQLME